MSPVVGCKVSYVYWRRSLAIEEPQQPPERHLSLAKLLTSVADEHHQHFFIKAGKEEQRPGCPQYPQ